jgi:hypothetical protein
LFKQNGKLYLTWKIKAGTEGFALEQITHIYTNNSSNNSNNSSNSDSNKKQQQLDGINSSSSSSSSSTTACPTAEPQSSSSICEQQQQQQQRYKLTMCVSHSARQVECYVNSQQECDCWYGMLTALVNKEKGELKLKVPLLELPKAGPQHQQTTTSNNSTDALSNGGAGSSSSSANGCATTVPDWSYTGIQ